MVQLYKIGEIAKVCNISIKTLRYYEDFGLIKPREIVIICLIRQLLLLQKAMQLYSA